MLTQRTARILAAATLLASCAPPAATIATSPTRSSELSPSTPLPTRGAAVRLWMREGDAQGEQLAPVNAATDRVERTLPDGVPAPDWTRLYTLEPGGGSALSVLRVIDPRTGADVLTRQLDGHYEMPTLEGAVLEGLSADGHWLAVAGGERNPDGRLTTSSFLILDTRSWAPPRHVRLSGDFLFDGVSDSGRNLFLLESLTAPGPVGSPQYRVRRYDLETGSLDPVPVVDKSEAGGTMTGVGVSRVHSRDGVMQYTLYA